MNQDFLKGKIVYFLLAGFLVVAFGLQVFWRLPNGYLQVFFLNIGQGDSVLIRSPVGHNILIDGGPGSKVVEELSAILPFYEKHIDLLILTHPDQDHIEGLISVLDEFTVGQVLMTGVHGSSNFYHAFLQRLKRQDIPIEFAKSSIDYQVMPGFDLDVLMPQESAIVSKPQNANDASVVIRLTYGQQTIFFSGDIEKDSEVQLFQSHQDLQSNILKVAHHGSRTSTHPSLLKAIAPQYAVIQSAEANRFNHPHSEVISRLLDQGTKVFRNDFHGRILLVSDGINLKWLPEIP